MFTLFTNGDLRQRDSASSALFSITDGEEIPLLA